VSRPAAIILAIVLALSSTEGLAYWWMHPAPAGLGQPVLCYRPLPSRSAGVPPASSLHNPQSTILDPQSSSSTDSSSSFTPLPDVVTKSLPSLHCSTGTAARIDLNDGATVNLAFFEWDLVDTTNVLEAYKHLPDECMGSIGMKLIEHQPPRSCEVGGETLTFDHTVFRDPRGIIVHAFKGTWVSGAVSLLGNGVRGGSEQWNQLRWRAGLKRFHPAYARVAQGAVHGIQKPDIAWQTFHDTMLVDLTFESVGRGGLAAP